VIKKLCLVVPFLQLYKIFRINTLKENQ